MGPRIRARALLAEALVRSIEFRLYVSIHARQLHWSELIGGRRIFRITAARTVRRKLTAEHAETVRALSAKPISTWSRDDLPAVLCLTRGRCTWPLRDSKPKDPPPVRAARMVS